MAPGNTATLTPIPGMPADPAIAGSATLIGEGGAALVQAALENDGWTVIGQRPAQALYRPGRSLLVRHTAWAERGGQQERLSVSTELRAGDPAPAPETWIYPVDPGLPALGRAVDASHVREWLGAPEGRPVQINAQSYRPKRRAVLRYRVRAARRNGGGTTTTFAKVMTPGSAERTWELGQALDASGLPLALPSARPERDVLLFDELEGESLRTRLVKGGPLPAASRVLDVMRSIGELGAVVDEQAAARPAMPGLRHAVRVLRHIMPAEQEAIAGLGDAIGEILERHPVEPRVIHGDFYEGQVMVRDDFSLALLDLDDLGVGDPALDAANFSAHLVALADSYPEAAPRLLAYRAVLREQFLREFNVADEGFAAREALVMVQLATGPFRVLEQSWPERVLTRLRLATALLVEPAGIVAG